MATTSKTAKNVFVVINQDNTKKEPLAKTLGKETLESLARYGDFYTILHDRYSEGEGEETIHRHLLIIGSDTLATAVWIEALSLIFSVPRNCIQLEVATNPRKCGRYLIHRDDEFKYQFPREEVQTNNKKQFDSWLLGGKVTAHVLQTFEGGKIEFLNQFGAENYKRYYVLLEDIRREQRLRGELSEMEALKEEVEALKIALHDSKYMLLRVVNEEIAKVWPKSVLDGNLGLRRDVECLTYAIKERIENK